MTTSILASVLAHPQDVAPQAGVDQWWPHFMTVCGDWPSPIERAIAGGVAADRVAWAFGAGYQAALRVLDADLPDQAIASLCVTESGGNSPRAVQATLTPGPDGYRLNGHKKWATLGPAGTRLLVVARLPEAADPARPRLKVARVDAMAAGVRITTMPATRFVPEMPHAELHLRDVLVGDDDLLPGDGYTHAVKPFRTIEDIHVNAAILAYLAREARRLDWPRDWLAEALAALAGLIVLAGADPAADATHIALEGALRGIHRLAAATDAFWAAGRDHAAAERWQRDRALFTVAAVARGARFARACANAGLPDSDRQSADSPRSP